MLSTTFHFSNGTWSQGVDLPYPRGRTAAVAISDWEVLICGGMGTTGMLNSCWLYDHFGGNFTPKMPLNEAKWGHSLGIAHKSDGER